MRNRGGSSTPVSSWSQRTLGPMRRGLSAETRRWMSLSQSRMLVVMGLGVRRDDEHLQMREIMRQGFDFLLAQGIGDIRHCRHAAAGSHAGLVVVQRLEQIFLALPRNAGDGFRSGKAIGVTRRTAPSHGSLGTLGG